jgi:hypothetical protein
MLSVEFDASLDGYSLVSTEPIRRRGLVHEVCGHRVLARPTYKSVQIDLEVHIYALSPHVHKAASSILRAGETESNFHRSECCIAAAGGFGLASLSESD